MKKWIILGLLLFFLLLVCICLGISLRLGPYILFSKALNGEIQHEYLSLMKAPPQLIFPKRFIKGGLDLETFKGQDNLWGNFHFENFLIPMPLRHPYFTFVPNIVLDKDIHMGAKFLQPHSKEEFVSFLTGERFSLDMEIGAQKIFNLPYFKSYIESKGQDLLWEDLFTLDVTGGIRLYTKQMTLSELYEETNKFWAKPLQDWVYNLFLLEKRMKFFKNEIQTIDFKTSKKIGIAKKLSKDERMVHEIFYLLDGKDVFTLSFNLYPWDDIAKATRKKFLDTIEVKKTFEDESIAIYNSYLQLPYVSRIEQEGLTYLFCAWSHQTASKDYLRMMIKFLEKGKENNLQTAPLYEYAYHRFGSNFSTREDTVQEDSESRLKRKMGEELERELTDAEKKEFLNAEGNFQSDEAKMKYYLNKAKEKGVNTDTNENSLNME